MTDAKLLALPESHGLNETVCADAYDKLVRRDGAQPLVAVVVLAPAGYGELRDKKGYPRRHVDFRPVLLEVLHGSRAGQAREWLAQAIEERTGATSLPLDFGDRDEEQRAEFLKGLILEWAAEKDMDPKDLAAEWESYFGGSHQDGFVSFDQCRGRLRFLEFAKAKGVLPDEPANGKTSGDEEPALDEGTSDEEAKADTSPAQRRMRDVPLPADNVHPIDAKSRGAGDR